MALRSQVKVLFNKKSHNHAIILNWGGAANDDMREVQVTSSQHLAPSLAILENQYLTEFLVYSRQQRQKLINSSIWWFWAEQFPPIRLNQRLGIIMQHTLLCSHHINHTQVRLLESTIDIFTAHRHTSVKQAKESEIATFISHIYYFKRSRAQQSCISLSQQWQKIEID
jgi:hypothetical protein